MNVSDAIEMIEDLKGYKEWVDAAITPPNTFLDYIKGEPCDKYFKVAIKGIIDKQIRQIKESEVDYE